VLTLGAVATIANVVVYSRALEPPTPPGATSEESDEEPTDEGVSASPPLDPVDVAAVRSDLERWPGPGRSPFLSRIEALSVRADERAGRNAGPDARNGSREPWRVEGTMWSSNRRIAWIDGSPRSEGDWLRGYRIERIDVDTVVLRRGTDEWIVPVAQRQPVEEAATDAPDRAEEALP
jgi:hypothetical protein